MSLEKTGPDMAHRKKAEEYREARYKKVVEKAKESEYWEKPLPGINQWTVGELIEQFINDDILNMAEDTPEKLYRRFEAMEQETAEK